jgi:hypothetical protein
MTLQQDGLLLLHDRQTRTLVDRLRTDSTIQFNRRPITSS